MDTPTTLLLVAAIAGGVAVFLHILGKEKHRLEVAYKEQRRTIERERQYEENLRRHMAETRKDFQENAADAVERMVRGSKPASPAPAMQIDVNKNQPA